MITIATRTALSRANTSAKAADEVVVFTVWGFVSSLVSTCFRYAFLTFGNRARMLEAFSRYSSRELIADGQVVYVIKYEPPTIIPFGMYPGDSTVIQVQSDFYYL